MGFIFLNRPMYLEMKLWVTQKGERVLKKDVTACSIAFFSSAWGCEHTECAKPHHTPVSRSAWKALSREAETWKLQTEIKGFHKTVPSWVTWLSGVCRGANTVM